MAETSKPDDSSQGALQNKDAILKSISVWTAMIDAIDHYYGDPEDFEFDDGTKLTSFNSAFTESQELFKTVREELEHPDAPQPRNVNEQFRGIWPNALVGWIQENLDTSTMRDLILDVLKAENALWPERSWGSEQLVRDLAEVSEFRGTKLSADDKKRAVGPLNNIKGGALIAKLGWFVKTEAMRREDEEDERIMREFEREEGQERLPFRSLRLPRRG